MIRKYSKVTETDYRRWKNSHSHPCSDPYRLGFHLMPPVGWMNDPNGLHQKDGEYRICYQYDPFDTKGELKLWGLYTTKDFIHYTDEDPVLFPDSDADTHGVYSGSAFVENDVIHYFYTGNVKYFDRDDYDYINSGRGSNTIMVTGKDGKNVSEKTVVLSEKDYPEDMSCHIRDPKVFAYDGKYWMVLGARDCSSKGMVLMYESDDLCNWHYRNRITTDKTFGYMWECPDLFMLDGQWYLTACPQGVGQDGYDYANVHQSCWMKIDADFRNNVFRVSDIHQLDRGTDFYAQQSFEDESGRRIMIGWLGIPDADYTNPTESWQHALTLPRQLYIKDGALHQKPIDEIRGLRKGKKEYRLDQSVLSDRLTYECEIRFEECRSCTLTLREGLTLIYENSVLTLRFDENGYGRTDRSVRCDSLENLDIFMDTSSVEIFVNDGKEVFTSRFFGMVPCFKADVQGKGMLTMYDMDVFEITEPKGLCAIGEALIDFVPDVRGVSLKDVQSFHRAAGGAPANVAGAVAKLGGKAKFLTKLGQDAFGDYIVETLREAGIDTSAVVRDDEWETALAFVSLKGDGNREFAFYRKNSADLQYGVDDIPSDILGDCGMVHFCSVDLVESPMKQAHRKLIEMAAERNITVCFDPNLRFSLWEDSDLLKKTVQEFMPLADIVKISDEELEFITGKTDILDALPQLLQGKTKCIVYTMGKDGAMVCTENRTVYAKGYAVKAVDTTGAGDSFIGAFEFCLLKDRVTDISAVSDSRLKEYLQFANAYAAYTTTKQGALSSMADADQMEAWMKLLQKEMQ